MRNRFLWIILTFLMALSLVLASCGEAVEEEEEEEEGVVVEEEEEGIVEEEEEEEEGPPVTGDWLDKLGEPEYDGSLTFRANSLPAVFDPQKPGASHYWYEHLFRHDWALDRNIWSYNTAWAPSEYFIGHLLESWEWPDQQTMIGHIRQGVYWHNKPPANGREFTAHDIEYHYDRVLGTGSGYTEPSLMSLEWVKVLEKVTAVDDYTVSFTFKNPTPFANELQIKDISWGNIIECPDLLPEDIDDWRNACGTGAYMLKDYVTNVSLTMSRNPDYWGYDERYPGNNLPYADEIKILNVADISTALAALRTGKIDWITDISLQQSKSLERTNPEIQQTTKPNFSYCVEFRTDIEPFNDINVRKALQLTIDRDTIAKTFYGGVVDGKPVGLIPTAHKGWYIPYDEWPEELKEEYSYNPERARELLAEAGYPNGFKTNILTSSTFDLELLQIIKAYFMDVGVDMEIRPMDIVTFMGFMRSLKHDQMYYGTFAGKTHPPTRALQGFTSHLQPNGTLNNDPVFDAMYDDLMDAGSTDEAKQIVIEADQYALRQHWGVVVCPTVMYIAWQPYLKGFSGEDFAWAHTREWVFPRLWVDQDMKKSMGR